MAAGPSNEHSITRTPSSIAGFPDVVLMLVRSRRFAPGRSGHAPLRAGVPGSRPLRSCGPHHRLHLGVRVEAEVAAVASDAAQLEAAERRLHVALRGVDADVAGAQPPCQPE